jgi:hypothetical protein
LLSSDVPDVRYLANRDLIDLPAGDAGLLNLRFAAHRSAPILTVLEKMDPGGYWVKPGPGYGPKYRSTVWAMILLAQLGASLEEDERIRLACNYVLEHNLNPGGQFSYNGAPSGTIDCLQGNLCWALLELGCDDPRLAGAFEWMARTVTGEGLAPNTDSKAALRYYAYQCGPGFACGANYKQPCAWGAAKVMLAFGRLPAAQRTPLIERAIQVGIDFLFSANLVEANWPCGSGGKPNRSWWTFGFPVFYVTDLLQIAEALCLNGYAQDSRLIPLLDLIRGKHNAEGQWALEYDYTGKTWGNYGAQKKPNPWVTLRALRVLKAAG